MNAQTKTPKINGVAANAKEFIEMLVKDGRKIGIFSCEDPYNTPFHRDLLNMTDYVHLVTKAAGRVDLSSLDIGLQAKGINAWGIFGHYGMVHQHEVCAAVAALNNGHSNYGHNLSEYLELLSQEFEYEPAQTLRENIKRWVRHEYSRVLKLVPEKQKALKDAVQGDIIIFGGLVENSHDGKDYKAEILFSNLTNASARH